MMKVTEQIDAGHAGHVLVKHLVVPRVVAATSSSIFVVFADLVGILGRVSASVYLMGAILTRTSPDGTSTSSSRTSTRG